MKVIFVLLLVGLLISLVLTEESKELHHKKKHQKLHKVHKVHKQHKHLVKHAKHGGKYTKRIGKTITFDLGNNRTIRGTVNETATAKATEYYLFQGVRFAKAPVGDLRFEPPQAYEIEGHYDALYEQDICIQNSFPQGADITGSEDCLFLNVYTPSDTNSSKLAVLVWIYGGGFINGNGDYKTYPTDNFIDQNLVVVTINYRLGVFGFMSTGDEVVPGNMGLKDQVLALKWVQNNIAYFGGDPNNVTIMGESAGAASVSYLVQSPATKGLFQRAIAHSGNTLCPWALSRKAAQNFNLLATKLFLTIGAGHNNSEIVRRMKEIDPIRLSSVSVASMNIVLLEDPLNGLVYAPAIETPNPTEVFSTKSFEQLDSGNFTKVPLIMGYNSAEGSGFSEIVGLLRIYLFRYDVAPRDLVPLDMNVNTTDERNTIGREIKELYWNNTLIGLSTNNTEKFVTQDFFVRATIKYIQLFSKWENNTYLYRFSYSTNSKGVPHAGELPYFFYDPNLTPGQKAVSDKVVKLWSNFIKTGNPTPFEEFNVTWEASSQSNNYSYLDIGEKLVLHDQSTNPDKYYLDKWEGWYTTYGNRPFDTY